MKNLAMIIAGIALVFFLGACSQQEANESVATAPTKTAEEFVARANAEFGELYKEVEAANWVRATYITRETGLISSAANEKYAKWHGSMVQQALAYDGQEMAPETRRSIDLLKLINTLPAPSDPIKRKELTQIATELGGMYGAGQYCRNDNDCISGSELEGLMQTSKDYDELEDNCSADARQVSALC